MSRQRSITNLAGCRKLDALLTASFLNPVQRRLNGDEVEKLEGVSSAAELFMAANTPGVVLGYSRTTSVMPGKEFAMVSRLEQRGKWVQLPAAVSLILPTGIKGPKVGGLS